MNDENSSDNNELNIPQLVLQELDISCTTTDSYLLHNCNVVDFVQSFC
jgi:hypothetical protein